MRSGSGLLDLLQVNEGLPQLVARIKLSKDESFLQVPFAFEAMESLLVDGFVVPEVSDGVLGEAEEGKCQKQVFQHFVR
jgi:hypothetical protein